MWSKILGLYLCKKKYRHSHVLVMDLGIGLNLIFNYEIWYEGTNTYSLTYQKFIF